MHDSWTSTLRLLEVQIMQYHRATQSICCMEQSLWKTRVADLVLIKIISTNVGKIFAISRIVWNRAPKRLAKGFDQCRMHNAFQGLPFSHTGCAAVNSCGKSMTGPLNVRRTIHNTRQYHAHAKAFRPH